MAGGGLDDELLALAGESGRRQIDMSSDEDDAQIRTGSKRDAKASGSGTSSSLAKKRRLDLLDESASGSEADAVGSDDGESSDDAPRRDPYPYQGIYKSAQDMEELMAMNELDREDILARRRDEIQVRRQKFELAALVKAQKAAAGATKKAVSKKRVVRGGGKTAKRRGGADSDLSEDESEEDDDDEEEDQDDADGDSDYGYGGRASGAASAAKSRKKKLPGSTDAKSAKLSELRKKRKEKAAGITRGGRGGGADSDDEAATAAKPRRRGYASSSASDVSYSSYSDDEDYPRVSRSKQDARSTADTSSSDPPSLIDLNAARITRDQIESRLYAPRWREILTHSFFRFSWGTRPLPNGTNETVYRIHQVTSISEKPGKFYDLSPDKSGKWCNVYLTFEHDGQERDAKLTMLSRGEFTESERERWIAFLKGSKQKIPKKAAVVRKADELEKFFTTPLTEADIGKILETKKRLRLEAISVMGGSAILGATAGFDSPRNGSGGTPAGIATPTNATTDAVKPQSLEARLAAVNERNRAQDRIKMSDVERKARSNKIAAAAAAKAEADRFKASQQQQQQQEGEKATESQDAGQRGVELTNEKTGTSGMRNGLVAVKNYATLVEVDLGDF
ncbi:related to RTF1 - subunit of the RNA polymerase II-associated Paf1 complex [Ustilago trichophora]|uniref:Related to RTF1 - subunit of the RNA polymerase II-associated Paf1 complex n=1 Tax=Ustilago trichophora TaxID=86804 RepID=A0A5C3EIB7_9BASI|nr:related to RTF1 - subunit of the RNA polymerase II-associated Paf1 complex [Ustilago trichophora]